MKFVPKPILLYGFYRDGGGDLWESNVNRLLHKIKITDFVLKLKKKESKNILTSYFDMFEVSVKYNFSVL
ncbi:hypothetical protein SOMG_01417 [Schizosaccharomyces osmophilus]|uniref:Uncharacterized protein n=1 Tax=Schizosaccharomyces osmophilus TaxID=2545709 RepID=A0AAE9W6U4_9SCHI|nr:uncharacterized protein SOMG_01417 [Schizosaccharomyces osmophilus]WBW70614.1 hypothetical protein SOMG_01417 [Schizosaccharomyces osmophilus]